jgi:hypothetical protein
MKGPSIIRESAALKKRSPPPPPPPPSPRRCRVTVLSLALAALAVVAVTFNVGIDLGLYRGSHNNSSVSVSQGSSISSSGTEDEDGGALQAHLHPLQGAVLLYMASTNDEFQRARVEEMRDAFREDLYVVWDNPLEPECPYRHLATCLRNDGSIFNVSETRGFTNRGYAQEVAVLWSIAHKHTFRHFWFMEEDVHYTDISQLVQVLTMPSSADLLNHGPLENMTDNWFWAKRVRQQSGNVFGNTSHYIKMLNLYRMSSALLDGVERIYKRKRKRWIFFEALIPTCVAHFNLTSDDWTRLRHKNGAAYQFRYRPCYTAFPAPGIYHPAKFRNGTFQPCDFKKVG